MKYEVYYWKPEVITQALLGNLSNMSIDDIRQTHMKITEIEAEDCDQAYNFMQAENWSSRGQAKGLLKVLGISHTSMSVGDILKDEEENYFICDMIGWKKL